MHFEFDPRKSTSNKRKHGIDFSAAQILWEDPERLKIPAKTEDESRYMVIGKIGRRCWSAIVTYRKKKIRIISVRKSNVKEVKLYES